MSNDLDKKRQQKVDDTVKKITDTLDKAYKQLTLKKLYEKKYDLEAKRHKLTGIDKANNKLQLNSIKNSIRLLENEGIDLKANYDIEVDEVSAREFLKKHKGFEEFKKLIEKNDLLDKLEKEANNGGKNES